MQLPLRISQHVCLNSFRDIPDFNFIARVGAASSLVLPFGGRKYSIKMILSPTNPKKYGKLLCPLSVMPTMASERIAFLEHVAVSMILAATVNLSLCNLACLIVPNLPAPMILFSMATASFSKTGIPDKDLMIVSRELCTDLENRREDAWSAKLLLADVVSIWRVLYVMFPYTLWRPLVLQAATCFFNCSMVLSFSAWANNDFNFPLFFLCLFFVLRFFAAAPVALLE